MASISNLAATTELEAVNAMLSAIGEAPITDVDTATQTDATNAIAILRGTARAVQSEPWRFNTEFGYELAPSATMEWTDAYGVSTLNIFKAPPKLISFNMTAVAWQQGSSFTDAVQRPSRLYTEGDPAAPALVFYDRTLNRDGWVNDYLYIDPIWGFDFEEIPQSARDYITTRAARQFIQSAVGSDTLVGFTERDEFLALRTLKRDQGRVDSYNIFANYSVTRVLGGRPLGLSGVSDWRATSGPR